MEPIQKKPRFTHLPSSQVSPDQSPKPRSRLHKLLPSSDVEESKSSGYAPMEVEEPCPETEDERLMRQYLKTKRLPKGKKLLEEQKIEMDAKGYMVTTLHRKIVDGSEPPKKIKNTQRSKKNAAPAGGKQLNMTAFLKKS